MGVDTSNVLSWGAALLIRAVEAEDEGETLALVDREGKLVARLPGWSPSNTERIMSEGDNEEHDKIIQAL